MWKEKKTKGKLWDWCRSEMSSNRDLFSILGTMLVALKPTNNNNKKTQNTSKKPSHPTQEFFTIASAEILLLLSSAHPKCFGSWLLVVIYSQEWGTSHAVSTKSHDRWQRGRDSVSQSESGWCPILLLWERDRWFGEKFMEMHSESL